VDDFTGIRTSKDPIQFPPLGLVIYSKTNLVLQYLSTQAVAYNVASISLEITSKRIAEESAVQKKLSDSIEKKRNNCQTQQH
jgi:hypothetical protein